MLLDRGGVKFAVIDVPPVIAVEEPRCKFSQIALPDRLTAQLMAGRPTIHDDEFHVPPPNEKQNTAAASWKLFGGGAQRWFRPSGLSRLRSTFCGGMGMYFPPSLRLA